MLEVGMEVPDFALPNQDGRIVRLSDYRGSRVVVFTFPKAGTAGCTMQACSFRDAFPHLEAQGMVVLGISGDAPDDLRDWKAKERLPYDLLSDPDMTVLDMFGGWGVPVLGFKLPMRNRTVWLVDEQGRVADFKSPVLPHESVTWVEKALKRVAPPARA